MPLPATPEKIAKPVLTLGSQYSLNNLSVIQALYCKIDIVPESSAAHPICGSGAKML